jgi:hypothetical protein
MNIFNESADEIFRLLLAEVGPKARTSLERIKAACDMIESMRGLMNYSRVAAVTTEQFGSPRAQTVQNSKQLKAYIAVRMKEYEEGKHPRPRRDTSPKYPVKVEPTYPVEGLDAKTRLFIDLMTQTNQRLEAENNRLAHLLEKETERRPISLTDAFSRGPTSTFGVDVNLGETSKRLPDGLKDALSTVLNGKVDSFVVQRRGDLVRLVYQLDGIENTLLSPSQWKEAEVWIGAIHREND